MTLKYTYYVVRSETTGDEGAVEVVKGVVVATAPLWGWMVSQSMTSLQNTHPDLKWARLTLPERNE